MGAPVDGEGFFGVDAGKTIDDAYYGGQFKYSFKPMNKDDWSSNKSEGAATSKRTLNGFISRSFLIEPLEGQPSDGLHFKHLQDGRQEVLHEANRLYDYSREEHPKLDLGTL